MRKPRTVCGKPKYHGAFGDEPHGKWVYVEERRKGQCGEVAKPRVRQDRGSVLAVCLDCGSHWPTITQAKLHWWAHTREHRPGANRKPIKHGTEAGYWQHKQQRGAPAPCDECKKAHSRHNTRKRQEWVINYGASGTR